MEENTFLEGKNLNVYHVFLNCQEILCHAALELLRVHYLKSECFFAALNFGRSTSLSQLALSQTTNFGPFKTERICGQQFSNLKEMAETSPYG